MMIKSIEINGVGGINNLHLDFHNGMNIICGTNGIGKTTILDCIGQCFNYSREPILKKNVNFEKGNCSAIIIDEYGERKILFDILSSDPYTSKFGTYPYERSFDTRRILYFKPNRDIFHLLESTIQSEPKKPEHQTTHEAIFGITFENFKRWFLESYIFEKFGDGSLNETQTSNYLKAKECFSILDKDIEFSKIAIRPYDIMVKTKQGEVYFEYLSSGYKSCVYILMGIIKEIDLRFDDPFLFVGDFNGIVLIDEIDLHLHPMWHTKLVKGIKEIVPKAQVITTTHNPSVVQCAESNEIIALDFNENNDVYVKKLNPGRYGFQGWTLEEILKDVMGMESVRSELYSKKIKMFEEALNRDDGQAAEEIYATLNEMLHPESHLRKVLDIKRIGLS